MRRTRVGRLIADARRQAGLTQSELAQAAGTSQPAIAHYESGRKIPSIDTLERLLRACGRSLVLDTAPLERRPISHGPQGRKLRRRRSRLLKAARDHGATEVRVFGSVARGEDSADSDIDLLVELAPGRTLLDLAGLREDAREILGTNVDVATLDILKPRTRREALREAIPL